MNIELLFERAAENYPGNFAIIEGERKISYADLRREVEETANYFLSMGITKGDRVLVFVPMGIDLYRIVLALFRIGAVAVFLDEWVSRGRMELCCRIAGCKGFIGTRKTHILSWFSSELRRIPVKLKVSGKLRQDFSNPPAKCGEEDTALITFTTGSTGAPKAADRTHGFLFHQFQALQDTIFPRPEDVDMPVLPILTLVNLGIGCTSVMSGFRSARPAGLDPGKIFAEIKRNRVSRITASPFLIERLSRFMIQSGQSAHFVKKIFTGGAPVFPGQATLFEKAFPFASIQVVYGSTEAEPISHIFSSELAPSSPRLKNGLPVGKIHFGTRLRIITITEGQIKISSENEFQNLHLKTGEVGEIIAQGDHVLKKYFGNNEEAFLQNKILVNGQTWHRTGDSGFLDEDGRLFLTGRCSTLFFSGKKLISPFLVEDHLRSFSGILLGTVLQLGGKVYFFIQPKKGGSKEEIRKFIDGLQIPYSEIIFLKIPRDPRHFSRIDYSRLAEISGGKK